MANLELKTRHNWLSAQREKSVNDGGSNTEDGSSSTLKLDQIDIERASRILNLCSTSLDEVKKAKSQVSQLVQYVEKSQQSSNIDWVEGIDRTKKLERFNRILGMLTSAIGKLEVLLSNMFKLTKGLSAGKNMTLGNSIGDNEINELFEKVDKKDEQKE